MLLYHWKVALKISEVILKFVGVSFIATANIGMEYTATRVIDRAILDRFSLIEMDALSEDDEYAGGDLEITGGGNGHGVFETSHICPRGKGITVVFPSYMMHRVSKVTKGTRRSLVLWVGGSHYR